MNNVTRKTTTYFSILILFIISIATSAEAADTAVADAAVKGTHPAEMLVKQTTRSIFTRIKENKQIIDKDSKILHKMVSEVILPHFDFNKMSGWVLGKYWRKANKNQKSQFTEQFRTLLVRTYADALASNADQTIKYLPIKIKSDTQVTVRTEIEQKGTFSLPISYRMHLKENKWKVFDVNIDGISLVTNYRSSFANEIRKGDIDKLIVQLTQRNLKAVSAAVQ